MSVFIHVARDDCNCNSLQLLVEAYIMDAQIQEAVPCIKVEFQLGSETYSVKEHKGILSEQLVSVKEESMRILKDFITRHNVPNDVPDELVENSSEDDGEILEKPPVKSKKTKFT